MTIKRRGRQLIAGAAMLMAGGALLGAATTNTASARPAGNEARAQGPGCITLSLVDSITRFYSNIPYVNGGGLKLGFMGASFDALYDSAGKQIGTSVLSAENFYKRPSDGHVFEYVTEALQLGDGTIAVVGAYDRVTAVHLAWSTGRATGLSGRYAGKSGTYTWRLANLKPPFPTLEKIVLCPS